MTADVDALRTAPRALHGAAEAARRLVAAPPAGWLVPLLVTAAAGAARFMRLGHPNAIVPLDETYYAPNAFGYLCHGADMTFVSESSPRTCAGLAPTFAVHPPVGKLLIAVGIKLFGYRPFGWRAAPALAGTLAVLLVYLIALRLWRTRAWATVAAVLVGVDGLFFVQSRLAMLDIFVALFVLLGAWLLLEDRARGPRGRLRPWRLGSGAALGLAVASKWAAVPLLPVVAGVAFAWEVVRIRAAARPDAAGAETVYLRRPRVAGPVARQALAIVFAFALLPAGVYLASYAPWFLSTKRYVPPRCHDVVGGRSVPKAGLDLWLCNQREIYDYHRTLKARDEEGKPIHPYMSQAWSWPWISRPAAHYFVSTCVPGGGTPPCPAGSEARDEEILGLPNPLVWWTAFFVALPACLVWTVRRDEVATILVVLLAPLVVPWFLTSRPLFMFYLTPAVPFLVLMLVHAMRRWAWHAGAAAFVALAVALFGYFYPVLAAYPLPVGGPLGWESRIWFGHGIPGDCLSEGIRLLCWI
jgi:dolichyl-phosphate-mannose-protein mannosyltransferase